MGRSRENLEKLRILSVYCTRSIYPVILDTLKRGNVRIISFFRPDVGIIIA